MMIDTKTLLDPDKLAALLDDLEQERPAVVLGAVRRALVHGRLDVDTIERRTYPVDRTRTLHMGPTV